MYLKRYSPCLWLLMACTTLFTATHAHADSEAEFTEATPEKSVEKVDVPAISESTAEPVKPAAVEQPTPKEPAAAASPVAQSKPPETDKVRKRHAWYGGFGFGSGPSQIRMGKELRELRDILCQNIQTRSGSACKNDDIAGFAGFIEFGKSLSQNLLIGAHLASRTELGSAPDEGEEDHVSYSVVHNSIMAAVTWFPMETGLLFRGGLGPASVMTTEEVGDASEFEKRTTQTFGFGMMAGVGFSFWLGKRFNLVISNDLHAAKFMGDETSGQPTEGWFNSSQLGFMWY